MAITQAPLNGRHRRLSPTTRVQLEEDIAQIKQQLQTLATKDDLDDVKRHIDSNTADILEALHGKDTLRGATG
jgi:hypothetical protein